MTRSLLLWLSLLITSALSAAEGTTERIRTYDQDPSHLWNRLHQTLFTRAAPDGTTYGHDRLDPLFWGPAKYLLEAPSGLGRAR